MRLFAAIELPEAVKRAIAARVAEAKEGLPPAAWVRSRNLHLTLVFFGDVADERVGVLADVLRRGAAGSGALELRIATAGGFPRFGRVRVVWLAVEPTERLAALAASLRRAATEAAFDFDDKPFASHLTLARCRRPWPSSRRPELARLLPRPPVRFPAAEATLLASELTPDGARYRAVARLPLGEVA